MLASINPLGERARNRRWGRTVAAYLVGSVLGGAALGALLGVVGDLAGVEAGSVASAGVVIALCGLGLVVDLGLGGLRLPTVGRQVDKDWLDRYRGWVYGVSFGFQLGLGVVTVVNTAAIYLTFVLALVSGSVVIGALIGTAFGLVRSLVILSVRTVRQPDELRQAHRRMQSWAPRSRQLSLGVQAAAGLGIAAMVIAG
ncbi:MAG: sulfite exporter TauE/SafE family protein [Acidimicrobiia bacterium]|nr:sulfite exporter TauE/SafE family protein [Acidimicrobiia bacterium]